MADPLNLPTISSGFSPVSLVLQADPVVQVVIIGLLLLSLICWAIIFEKLYRLWRLRWEVGVLETFVKQPQQLIPDKSVLAYSVIDAARSELGEAGNHPAVGETRSRLVETMRLTMISQLQRLESGLSFLATIGATAPFIGLFGTVWGIIHSFSAIAQARDTSLSVVAPGIAEALLATAVGLFAAIPAVIAYNQVLRELNRASQRMGAAIALIARAATRGRAQASAMGSSAMGAPAA